MKQKITNVSIQLFEKKGFSQTSIQDIVDALEVTKGTFYYYFPSKEKLLMDIHLDYINHLLERQKLIIDDEAKSYSDKLAAIIEMLILDIADKGPSGRVFFREIRHLINVNIDIIKEKRKQFRVNIEHVVKGGIEAGEFHPELQVNIVTLAILGLTNYSYEWYRPDGHIKPSELVSIYREMVLNGIINRP